MALGLKVKCLGTEFQNPVLVASGTFGYGDQYEDIMPIRELGGLVTKTITREPRAGNPPPRVVETDSGMLNTIGLANVGLEEFVQNKLPWIVKHAGGCRVIVNVAGFSKEEYIEVAEKIGQEPGVDALEVNLGCPNIKAGYIHFGADPQGVHDVIAGIKQRVAVPVIAKLSPNVTDIGALAVAAVDAGADGLSLINTLPGMKIDVGRRKPVLSMGFGGLSGPAIRPVGVACVFKVYQRMIQAGRAVPIIGIGGICCGRDAMEYILVGASLVQVGTASFVHPRAAANVIEEIREICEQQKVSQVTELVGLAHSQ